MRPSRGLACTLLVFLVACPLSNLKVASMFHWKYPLVTDLSISEEYLTDLGALLLGSHRVAGDIAYIQLLQYYGIQKQTGDDEGRFEAGNFPLLMEKAQRLLRLDPFFNEAIIEAAGALAFIEKKIPDALDLLAEAIRRDPTYYRYQIYVTAILYKNTGQDLKLIGVLEEAIRAKDCPPLLQSVLGNLLKKVGRYEDAARVYLTTIDTASAAGDRNTALHRLEALLNEHPELRPRLEAQTGLSDLAKN